VRKDQARKFLKAFPVAEPDTASRTAIVRVGTGPFVEVRTVSALVHLTILNARRGKAVADILNRAKQLSTQTQAPRSNDPK
jgi:hypothetical protein